MSVRPHSHVDDAEPVDAPLGSGAEIARKSAPLPGIATKSVLGARMQALAPASGEVALARRLDDIEKMVKAGTRVRCVFDLDNTAIDHVFPGSTCGAKHDDLHGADPTPSSNNSSPEHATMAL